MLCQHKADNFAQFLCATAHTAKCVLAIIILPV